MNGKNDIKKYINYLGRCLALLGALLGILHIIPNNGFAQYLLIGLGLILIIVTRAKND